MLVGEVGNVESVDLNLLGIVSDSFEPAQAQNGFDGDCFFGYGHSLFVIKVLEIGMIQNAPFGLERSPGSGVHVQDSRLGLQVARR